MNDRLSADEDVKVAKGGYLPTVDLIAGYGREQTDSPSTRALGNHNKETLNYSDAELRLRQMLFDRLNTPNEVARTQATVNSRAYYIQGTAESLALRTVEVYLEVLKRREMVALARNNLQAHERVNDQIKLRSERSGQHRRPRPVRSTSGSGSQQPVHRRGQPGRCRRPFFSSTGRLPDELEQPASVKGEVPENIELARQTVMDNNPYLKSAQADVYAAEKQYEVAKAPFYPRFDLELATSADDQRAGR